MKNQHLCFKQHLTDLPRSFIHVCSNFNVSPKFQTDSAQWVYSNSDVWWELLKVLRIGKYFQSCNPSLTSTNPILWVCFAFAISNTFLLKFDTIIKFCNTISMLLSCHSPKISQKCSNSFHYKWHLSSTGTLPFGGNSPITIWMGGLHHASVQNT